MTNAGMVFYVSNGFGFKLYLVHNFVYEAFYDIDLVKGKIKHIDGNLTNNN